MGIEWDPPKPRRRSPMDTGNYSDKKGGCCPMVAALRAAGRGNYRLANRYLDMAFRSLAGR